MIPTHRLFYPSWSWSWLIVRIEDPDRVVDPAEGLDPKVVEVYTKFVPLACLPQLLG